MKIDNSFYKELDERYVIERAGDDAAEIWPNDICTLVALRSVTDVMEITETYGDICIIEKAQKIKEYDEFIKKVQENEYLYSIDLKIGNILRSA
ncbi:hypothetical protein [Hungatella hathewayi]|uniref:hypothetical protein n=1 Tax=Hungatella hathewayi TaxID=154046 RepID=UPI003565B048